MDFPNATGFRFQREILNEALTAGASKALHSGRALSSTGKPKRFPRAKVDNKTNRPKRFGLLEWLVLRNGHRGKRFG